MDEYCNTRYYLAIADVCTFGDKYRTFYSTQEKQAKTNDMIERIYIYCTDFTITMANGLGISYEEFNAWLFCIIWPLFTIVLSVLLIFQIRTLKNAKLK